MNASTESPGTAAASASADPWSARAIRAIRALGRAPLQLYCDLAELFSLFYLTMIALLERRFDRREMLLQAFEIGNRSVVFLVVTMGFIGMIMVLQACYQAERIIGDYSLVGPSYLQLLVREFAPTIGAMMVATRVGAGIAAEIGSMAVTEQLDALRMNSADPIEELIAPRVVAAATMVPAVLLVGGLAAELSGLVTGRVSFNIPYETFMNARLVKGGDAIVGLTKCLVYGWVIPVISARAGMSARGGSAGVGGATTRAVIESSLAIIWLDFLLNLVLFPLYERGA